MFYLRLLRLLDEAKLLRNYTFHSCPGPINARSAISPPFDLLSIKLFENIALIPTVILRTPNTQAYSVEVRPLQRRDETSDTIMPICGAPYSWMYRERLVR